MKQTIYILTFFTLLTASNFNKENGDKEIMSDTVVVKQSRNAETEIRTEKNGNSLDCAFVYDTITDKKYRMHLIDKFEKEDKRSYYFLFL